MTIIRAVVVLPASRTPRDVAVLRIDVLDVTEQDAPARTVASTDLTHVQQGSNPTEVSLDLEADLRPDRDYAVRATADVAGTGEVSVGDLVTTERVPVSSSWTTPRCTLREVTDTPR